MAAGLQETWVKDDCPGHSAEANKRAALIAGPQRWPGLCPLLNDDQESHLGSKVLSDFDVLWAEKYNKRSQMVWSMRIHHNEIDKVTGKIRQICQVGRIRNNSRNVGTSWLSKFLGVTLTREKKLTVRSYYCIYFSLCVDLSPWVECNLNERHFGN